MFIDKSLLVDLHLTFHKLFGQVLLQPSWTGQCHYMFRIPCCFCIQIRIALCSDKQYLSILNNSIQ